MDKIDIHDSVHKFENALTSLKNDLSLPNYNLIKEFLDASAIGKTARKNAHKKQVGLRARTKNLFCLKVIAKAINKPLDKIRVEDVENFIRALNENTIHKATGRPYSEQTKSNIKVNLISFLRYTIKDNANFSKLTDWIETSFKRKDIQALDEIAIKKMLGKCLTLQQRFLIALLFDTGCRIEEFLNIRLSDVTKVEGDISYYRVLIRNEFSKTAGRHIHLLWKPTTEIMNDWIDEHPEMKNNNLEAPLFDSSYGYVRKILYKVGKRTFGKSINPHLMRHSSATYYAGQGYDYFQLCKRYGWSIGSNMPNTYIDRSGIKDKEQVDRFINTNIKDLNQVVDKLRRDKITEKNMYEARLKNFESELKSLMEEVQLLRNQKN